MTVNISRMDLIWSSIWTVEERCHVDVPPDKRLDNGVPKWHHNNIRERKREREAVGIQSPVYDYTDGL